MQDNSRPVGVFDSGIGGLTVVHHLLRVLPHERIVYFGDTARVPYGSRSRDVVEQYAVQDAAFLLSRNVKAIIVACNTVSAVGIDAVRNKFAIPILGVILPGARAAAAATKTKRIGVIGTIGTIASNSYTDAIHAIDPLITVVAAPCPLFVPLVEEGWTHHRATQATAEEYLKPLHDANVDTLVLGCTHYPLLTDVIQSVMGPGVRIINSGEETANDARQFLADHQLLNPSTDIPHHEFFVSDAPLKFQEIGERFLGTKLEHVEKVDIYAVKV